MADTEEAGDDVDDDGADAEEYGGDQGAEHPKAADGSHGDGTNEYDGKVDDLVRLPLPHTGIARRREDGTEGGQKA